MLAAERHQIILDTITASGRVRVAELSQEFGISRMTVNRDLTQLADKGLIEKVFGGAIAKRVEPVRATGTCAMCGMRVQQRTNFVVNCVDGSQMNACCPHCGLMLLSSRPQAVSGLTADFLHGRMINVREAIFLVAPNITLCCTPAVLSFASPEEGERFQRGFGGQLMNLVEAQAFLHEHMTLPA